MQSMEATRANGCSEWVPHCYLIFLLKIFLRLLEFSEVSGGRLLPPFYVLDLLSSSIPRVERGRCGLLGAPALDACREMGESTFPGSVNLEVAGDGWAPRLNGPLAFEETRARKESTTLALLDQVDFLGHG